LKHEFLLDPGIAYLNHGSFGACPRRVFEAYQRYQRDLEREPVDFLQRHFPEKMRIARSALAEFLHCGADDIAFVRNATYGMNLVARSLRLGRGDVVLITDHEYGAVDRMWRFVAEETGAELVRVPVSLPAASPEAMVDAFRQRIDSSVRVMAIPHIAAEPALLVPVGRLVRLAREAGVVSVVDGAHAPGQVPIDLGALGADFYVGNCHKWLMSPKGAGFVFAAPHQADRVRPPIIGWGTISEGSSALLLENEWQGTSDISAFLAVGDAIAFLQEHDWFGTVVPACARLLEESSDALLEVTGQESLYASPDLHAPQMASFRLPPGGFPSLHADLFGKHQVELPVFSNPHGEFFRVSVQAYNSAGDLRRLEEALRGLL
jgi:isopenicillin-N epimerase